MSPVRHKRVTDALPLRRALFLKCNGRNIHCHKTELDTNLIQKRMAFCAECLFYHLHFLCQHGLACVLMGVWGEVGGTKRIRLGGWARNAEKKQIGCKGVFTDGGLGKVVDF